MSDRTPNPRQRKLIRATNGIYAVDAGAGTGKTFSITRRYATLIDQAGVEPDDVLLMTFTNNAAMEMKERIVDHCAYDMAALRDAPIQTFHSFCHDMLTRDGFGAPAVLGVDDTITSDTRILDNEVVEARYFRTFLDGFVDAHPEYHDFFRVLSDRTALLDIIKQLAAKGVFPTANGWFRDGEAHLDGDEAAFLAQVADQNEPNEGAIGPTQSDLHGNIGGAVRDACYLPDAPSEAELRYAGPDNQANEELITAAFNEDRTGLKSFLHDVYFEYLEFSLGRNYLNFSFLLMYAFALLCADDELRARMAFEYVMVDEFQDTSEIQFKLALLLADTDNLCVVGDWKQSIYGFQYASVENIDAFGDRLEQFTAELNADRQRIDYPVGDVTWIKLRENYRSTQSILDFSEHSLTLEAVDRETIDSGAVRDELTSLVSKAAHDHSNIEAFTSNNEYEAILDRVDTIVGNRTYGIETEDGGLRLPTFDDIAVLTRTRRFGREFQRRASDLGFPVAYEGGVELFGTDQALLVLAWLRLLEHEHSDRGWAVVLERAGYTLDEVIHILDIEDYPSRMDVFREELESIDTIGGIARRILDRYGYNDAYADAMINTLEATFDQSTFNSGDVVQFLERSLAADSTVEVDDSPGPDSITVQTIHAAKGLQHPIVIVANVNRHSFPPSGGGADRIRYQDPIGLRQSKVYATVDGTPFAHDNWRYDVLSACFPREYDEERRLMYVAMTRAKDHLLFSAGSQPSPFFEGLPLEPAAVDPDVEERVFRRTTQTRLQIAVPTAIERPSWTPHTLMDDRVFSEVEEGMGPEFGRRVHEFAEAYIEGERREPENDDERHLVGFLSELDGELMAEEPAYLPIEVNGEQITISGVIDLLVREPGSIRIIDFKTDRGRLAETEYRKQLSVYSHVVSKCYPDRNIEAGIFYTVDGTYRPLEPHSIPEISEMVLAEQSSDN